jgi:hypothetical protein
MSWRDIMQRVLPPTGRVTPAITQAGAFGAIEGRKYPSSIPHGGVDFNYLGGQAGINLTHPALRSPVAGTVTNAGEGSVGRIAIRDANGFLHEILHTNTRNVKKGDRVTAGQWIGTMGNTGTKDQHVHYQLRNPAGKIIDPTLFWDQQGPIDPNPSPPAFVQEYRQYLQGLGVNAGNGFGNASGSTNVPAVPFASNTVGSPDNPNSFGDHFGKWVSAPTGMPPTAASDSADSFGDRFGNWSSAPAGNSGGTDSPLLRALEKYRKSAVPDGPASVTTAPPLAPSSSNNSSAPVFDPSNPPPIFAPSNYYAVPPNDSIQKWIASLAGVDADDPTEFSPPPIFSPLYRR